MNWISTGRDSSGWAGLTSALLFVSFAGDFAAARAEPSSPTQAFVEGDLDAAFDALDDEAVLLVEVGAEWCGPCNQLANEVLDTPLAGEVLGKDGGVRVDFESEQGQAVKRKCGVIGLPTLLVLHREGFELGRVEGYPGRAEWVDAVRDARAGRVGFDALVRRARKAPRDLEIAIELAQARLVRGDTRAAMRALDSAIARSDKQPDPAAHAARIKGRWLLRVREDGPAALSHFEAMRRRFAGTRHESHFIYWTASAHELLGDRRAALELFVAWRLREPTALTPLELQADFMVHNKYPIEATEAVVRELLARQEDASACYLLSSVLARKGDVAAALVAAERAVALDATSALYHNHLRRLGAP